MSWWQAMAARSVSMRPLHLPPTVPSKIICVHLNYTSRVEELMVSLPPAPTYFHKPVSTLNAHERGGRQTSGLQVVEL